MKAEEMRQVAAGLEPLQGSETGGKGGNEKLHDSAVLLSSNLYTYTLCLSCACPLLIAWDVIQSYRSGGVELRRQILAA